MSLVLLLPVHAAIEVAGDSARGFFEVAIRLRALVLLRVRRVVVVRPRALARAAAPSPGGTAREASAAPGAADVAAQRRPRTPLRERARAALLRLDVLERVLARRAVRVSRPAGWLVVGCEDPADTGIAFGVAAAVAALLDPQGAVALAPLWTFEDRIAGEVALEVRVVPLRLAAVLLPALRAPRAPARGLPRARHAA